MNDYSQAKNHKLNNYSKVLNDIKDSNDQDKNINDKLIDYYDDDFNDKYDKVQELNRNILARNQLIHFNQDSFDNKIKYINILKNAIGILFFTLIIWIGYLLNILGGNTLTYLVIGAVALFIIISMYSIIRTSRREIGSAVKSVAKVGKVLYPSTYSCPGNCKSKWEQDSDAVKDSLEYPREMSTDSTLNYWISDPDAEEEEEESNIREETATKYTCQWEGGVQDMRGSPQKFTGAIPCKYYPGYRTV